MSALGGALGAGVSAIIRFGMVTPTDNAALFNENGDAGIWEDWFIRSEYISDYHRYMLPLTSPEGFQGATCAFVQLAAPTTLWVVDWTCEKRTSPGDYPVYPDPQPTKPNIVLLDIKIMPDMVNMGADGVSPIYRLSGVYTYGFKDPTKAKMYHGRPPWMNQSVPRNVLDNYKRRGIIGDY